METEELETEDVDVDFVDLKARVYEWECPACEGWNDVESWYDEQSLFGRVKCVHCDREFAVGKMLHKGE